jgi:hypothetical protein
VPIRILRKEKSEEVEKERAGKQRIEEESGEGGWTG